MFHLYSLADGADHGRTPPGLSDGGMTPVSHQSLCSHAWGEGVGDGPEREYMLHNQKKIYPIF